MEIISEFSNKPIDIASIILAGGKGTRLFPLTLHHSKPAVSYGGRYRLIDIPISNSLNSNIRQIFVIGQYLTTELQNHLSQTYQFDAFFPGMLDLLTPEELPTGKKIWFDGTADAIRKNLDKILKSPADYFLILSGDQLYNINFKKMFDFTKAKDADLTIAALPVDEHEAKRMGILKVDNNCFVTDFMEKPQDDKTLSPFLLPDSFFKQWDLPARSPQYLGSMGIYIFKRETLRNLLIEDPREDFGKHLIPTEIVKGKTTAFLYNGYWEDIGTIESFYNANIALTSSPSAGLKTYDEKNPIFTTAHHLPGTKLIGTKIAESVICEGSLIRAQEISKSVVGLRTHIKQNTIIRNCVIMGNRFYLRPSHQHYLPERFEICDNCLLEKVIVDEHVYIGNNVKLTNKDNLSYYDGDNVFIRDGIIIIPAGSYIPDGYRL